MASSSIMLDIETLSTDPNATILSIAAVKFHEFTDINEPNLDTFHTLITLESQEDRHIDDKTVQWWANQDHASQAEVFAENGRIPLADALAALSKFIWLSHYIWAQGPVFDIVILESAYRQCNLPVPWQYYQIRDSRTLLDLVDLDLPKATHNALDDCTRQLVGVKMALKKLSVEKFSR